MASRIDCIGAPRYIETIAGGASEAPRRKSLPVVVVVAESLSKSPCSSTPLIKAAKVMRNLMLSSGFFVGERRFSPVFVIRE